MSPEVTILMSVYNDEKYLKKSIDSILNQTFKNFKFIIFDDASTDGSIEILEKYEKKDSRIKLIKQKNNKGLSYNLEKGVLIADTQWIARMDADDISVLDRLEIQMNFMRKNPEYDVIGSYVIDIDDNDNEIELRKVPTSHEKISKLIWTCPFIHPTVLFRKSAILKAGSYNKNLRRRQDYDLWFRCHKANLKFHNIDAPLLYYRFTDEYYKKNGVKVQFQQAKLGYKGAKKVNASLIAYFGITAVLLKGILPPRIRKVMSMLFKRFDPRRA